MPDKARAQSACGYEHLKSQAASMSFSLRNEEPGMLCRSGSFPGNSVARHGELCGATGSHNLGTDRLVQSPNQQKSGLPFQLSNGDEVKKTYMVVKTNQNHTGKVLELNKCLLEEN